VCPAGAGSLVMTVLVLLLLLLLLPEVVVMVEDVVVVVVVVVVQKQKNNKKRERKNRKDNDDYDDDGMMMNHEQHERTVVGTLAVHTVVITTRPMRYTGNDDEAHTNIDNNESTSVGRARGFVGTKVMVIITMQITSTLQST